MVAESDTRGLEVDHVQVGHVARAPRRRGRASRRGGRCAGSGGARSARAGSGRPSARSRLQTVSDDGGHGGVADGAAVRARVGQAEQHELGGDHLVHVVEVAVGEVEQRQVQQLVAVALEQRSYTTAAGSTPAAPARARDGIGRRRVVVDRVGQARNARRSRTRSGGRGRRESRRPWLACSVEDAAPALGVAQRRHAARCRRAGRPRWNDAENRNGFAVAVQAEEHTDRAGERDLGLHVETGGDQLSDPRHLVPPPLGRVVRLLHR